VRRVEVETFGLQPESKRTVRASGPKSRNSGIHKIWKRMCALLLSVLWLASTGKGQEKPNDLSNKSLEDLMNIEVTSVSRKEQKISQVAAAIFVITPEDIRRSGATTIPDLLRMVPGLDVAQINASNWAISARGFNLQFADKLLVLIDGRAVYTPLFGGVYWDVQNVPLEDSNMAGNSEIPPIASSRPIKTIPSSLT